MRKLSCLTLAIVLLAVAGLLMQQAQAANLGRIEKVTGKATLVRSNGTEVEAKAGLDLAAGDQLKTGKGSALWFSLDGAGQFRLFGESQMAVDELSESKSEDTGISLRMILGYLTSKVSKLRSNASPVTIHTTTATIGIRGTEFDTVAALDGSSAVVVDEGLVEVDSEGGQVSLPPGKMTEVDADGKSSGPVQATSREGRENEWEAWRQKREEAMIKFLPERMPKMKARFERGSEMFTRFTAKLGEASTKLLASMDEFKRAKAEGRPARLFQARQSLRRDFLIYKAMVMQFRKGMNRIRISAVQVGRIKYFVAENKSRFSPQDLEGINSNLQAISAHSEQLVQSSLQTMQGIRQTFAQLIEMRKEMQGDEAGSQQGDSAGQGGFQRQRPFQGRFQNR